MILTPAAADARVEAAERRTYEDALIKKLGLSGRVADLPLDLRRLAVVVAQLQEAVAALEARRRK